MVGKGELKILIEKHFKFIEKNKTIDLKLEDKDKLIEYFSNMIFLLQFYENMDFGIPNNRFVNDDEFISVLCACNNAGAS